MFRPLNTWHWFKSCTEYLSLHEDCVTDNKTTHFHAIWYRTNFLPSSFPVDRPHNCYNWSLVCAIDFRWSQDWLDDSRKTLSDQTLVCLCFQPCHKMFQHFRYYLRIRVGRKRRTPYGHVLSVWRLPISVDKIALFSIFRLGSKLNSLSFVLYCSHFTYFHA